MTSPSIGHPDYQSYAVWRTNAISKGVNVALAQGVPLTVTSILTNYSSLLLLLSNNSATGMTVSVNWSDGPGDVPVFSWNVVVGPNGSLQRILPALGNYVTVNFSTQQAAGTHISYRIAPSNLAANYPATPSQMVDVAPQPSQLVAASGTVTAPVSRVDEGLATLISTPLDNSGALTVKFQTFNESGGVVFTHYIETLPAVANQSVIAMFGIHSAPGQIVITNSDAANPHSLQYYYTVKPR